MINASNTFITAMKSPLTQVYIKLEMYDSSMTYLREITQEVHSDIGTLTISSDSPIRRSFSLTLDNSLGEFIFGDSSLIWLDKRLKLFIGCKTWSGDIEYVPQGVFVLTEPQNQHTTSNIDATINAKDKAYFMTDNRGKFINNLTIQTGAKITDAIRLIATDVGETMFNFDDVQDTVPYELTYSGTDNRWNALQELASLAKCTISYNVDGYLTLRKIDLNSFDNEPITWEYRYGHPDEKFYAGSVRQLDDGNLFNDIVVLGGNSDTATSSYRLTVDETNPIWEGHPYSIQKIGINSYLHNDGNPDPLLADSTGDLCKFRAKYELMQKLGFTEKVQLSTYPNYIHECGDVIFIEDIVNGIEGSKYLIQQITLPLSPSIMAIDCIRYNRVISNWDFI